MEKILLTGATGFIGSRLIPLLTDRYEVTALHRYVTGRYVLGENIHSVFADLKDTEGITNAVIETDPNYVIHLAAISPVAYSYTHPQEVTEVNYMGLINLAEACRQHCSDFKQFITAGTSEEYGNQPYTPIKENAYLYPNSPYAVSKVASTKYLEYMRDAYNFPITICRPFNTYGRTENRHFVTERIITQMLQGIPVIKLGDPDPIRDMLFRDDHVGAYRYVLGSRNAIGETFNFCTGEGYTIKQLAEICADVIGWKGEAEWNTIPRRPLDIDVLIGDNSKAEDRLGWKPKYDIWKGISKIVRELEKTLKP